MKRLLTAAITVTAIAAFTSSESRHLSTRGDDDVYVASRQHSVTCKMQEQASTLSLRFVPEWCIYRSR